MLTPLKKNSDYGPTTVRLTLKDPQATFVTA